MMMPKSTQSYRLQSLSGILGTYVIPIYEVAEFKTVGPGRSAWPRRNILGYYIDPEQAKSRASQSPAGAKVNTRYGVRIGGLFFLLGSTFSIIVNDDPPPDRRHVVDMRDTNIEAGTLWRMDVTNDLYMVRDCPIFGLPKAYPHSKPSRYLKWENMTTKDTGVVSIREWATRMTPASDAEVKAFYEAPAGIGSDRACEDGTPATSGQENSGPLVCDGSMPVSQ